MTIAANRIKAKLERKEKIQRTVSFISRFHPRRDDTKAYSNDSDLYFWPLGGKRFMVINHFNTKMKPEFQGFDLRVSEYTSTREIGNKDPLSTTTVKLGIDIAVDENLIDGLLKGAK